MMHNISKIIVLVSSMVVASVAMATDWRQVYVDYLAIVYIDKDSIKMRGDKVTCVEKWNFNHLQSFGMLKYNSMLDYRQFDCKQKTSGSTSIVFFMADKKVFSRNYPIEMKPISPDSRDNHIFPFMCPLVK